jgi:hypothetical protein
MSNSSTLTETIPSSGRLTVARAKEVAAVLSSVYNSTDRAITLDETGHVTGTVDVSDAKAVESVVTGPVLGDFDVHA